MWRSQTPDDIVRRKPSKSLGWSCPLLPRRKSLCTPTAPRPVRVLRCWFQETVKALMHQARRDEGGGSISIMVEHFPWSLVLRALSISPFPCYVGRKERVLQPSQSWSTMSERYPSERGFVITSGQRCSIRSTMQVLENSPGSLRHPTPPPSIASKSGVLTPPQHDSLIPRLPPGRHERIVIIVSKSENIFFAEILEHLCLALLREPALLVSH